MIKHYQFQVEGTAAQGQTWMVEGDAETDWLDIMPDVMRYVFFQLTHGKAVYGHPGVGCKGPYNVTRFLVEQVKTEQGKSEKKFPKKIENIPERKENEDEAARRE